MIGNLGLIGQTNGNVANGSIFVARSAQLHDLIDKLKAIQFDLSELAISIDCNSDNGRKLAESVNKLLGAAITHNVALDIAIHEGLNGKPFDMRLISDANEFCSLVDSLSI